MTTPVADLTIRPATANDLPALRELWLAFEAYLDVIGESIGQPATADPAKFDGFADLAFGPQPLCTVLLAERAGLPVGYLVYHVGVWMDDMAPALFVADLYVHPRGERIGPALMARAREIAGNAGCRHLFWTVWRENRAAQDFYRALGAEVFDEEVFMRWPVRPRP